MADGKKQRSARLLKLALNQIETDNSSLNTSNRQVSNTTACGSSQRLGTKRARSLSAQFQSTSEFRSDSYNSSTSQAQTFDHSHKKQARSVSTHVKPASNIESLNSSQEDILLPSISTDQNWTRRRAKVLSTHFECETRTESCNALDHAGSIIHNIQHSKRDVTSPHLKKLESTIPTFHTKSCTSESIVRELAQSSMQFTSTSGPLRSRISQNKIINPKLMVMDIVENDNPISDNSQGYIFNVSGTLPQPINSGINIGENAGKSVMVRIGEKEIMPCSFKIDKRDSDTFRQSSYEQVLSELKGHKEKTRRHVSVRGGKFGSPCISKENISNIKTTLLADIEASSEDEKPPITQERPCKRVRTRGGKSCLASTSNGKTTSIEEELTDIIGTTSENENLSKRPENENLLISDEQLLQILDDPDENNYDDDIFDADFIENMNHSNDDSDTSIVSEDELVSRNTEEDQEWLNHYRSL